MFAFLPDAAAVATAMSKGTFDTLAQATDGDGSRLEEPKPSPQSNRKFRV
jgi:hypothetical protein